MERSVPEWKKFRPGFLLSCPLSGMPAKRMMKNEFIAKETVHTLLEHLRVKN